MPYTDLLRLTVFLTAGEATALGGVTVLSAAGKDDTLTLLVAAGWWTLAVVIGLYLGRRANAAEGVREVLGGARTATSLPVETPTQIALERLWPIAVTAIAAGALGFFWPGVTAIAAGYALLVALAWRTREAAVLGVEDRDGVKFFVEPTSALSPVELVRTPGLGTAPSRHGHPPPPPPAI
jgi:hypothetical protein